VTSTDITDIDPPEGVDVDLWRVDVERDIVVDPPPVDASQYRRPTALTKIENSVVQ